MANAQDIKRRIKSVTNTAQITKAMKMVSAAKLRRTQGSLMTLRPYADRVEEVVSFLRQSTLHHPFLEEREVKRVLYVVAGGDRGLCGGYNGNLARFADGVLAQCPAAYEILPLGSRVQDHFHGSAALAGVEAPALSDTPDYTTGAGLAKELGGLYLDGTYDEIYLIYTKFQSAMTQKPVCRRLLPVPEVENADAKPDLTDYIFEPSGQAILESLLPLYLENCVYRALLESKVSEHGARMTAMSAATDNASEMINKLTLSLNRARQAAITTEITEIVGGAAALDGSRG